MATSPLNLHIRTATEQDIIGLHQVFEASVRQTCNQHYTEAQINAWVTKADINRWQELFNSDLVFIPAEDNETHQVVGFTSINAEGYLHSMFVHPDYQHKGIAQLLLTNAEQLAVQNHASDIHVEASITARSFFEKAGYAVEKEQTVVVNGTAMTNFVMQKQLITQPTLEDYDELLAVWEASVRNTHHFLTEEHIQYYKPLVHKQYFPAVELYIIRNTQKAIAAFMGVSDNLVEMLFVHPNEQGKGYGKQLMQFALHIKHIYKVDVNEQNEDAYRFYQHLGFQVIGRDATDATGNPFPILHLQRMHTPKTNTEGLPLRSFQ